MAKLLVTDELREVITPLLPLEPPKPKGGRPRLDDRAALVGILFVLQGGIPWELLPTELGYGSGVTCWRRLRKWQRAGVWDRLHRVLLDRLGERDAIDRSRAALDSASIPATKGARYRPESDGPRHIGSDAPWCGRPRRHSPRQSDHGGQRPQLVRLRGTDGCPRAPQAVVGRPRK